MTRKRRRKIGDYSSTDAARADGILILTQIRDAKVLARFGDKLYNVIFVMDVVLWRRENMRNMRRRCRRTERERRERELFPLGANLITGAADARARCSCGGGYLCVHLMRTTHPHQ